jgi:hypothetical protein
MRRLLRSIANGSAVGDITTIEDGVTVEEVSQAYFDLHKVVDTS